MIDTYDNDYDISWDYEVDERVKKHHLKLITTICEHLKKDLLPKLKLFGNFVVTPILFYAEREAIAVYINGTCEHPVIGVDIPKTLEACRLYDTELETAIESSILHELAHAIQEWKDKPFDEDEAEDFAYEYTMNGIVNAI